VPLLLRKVAEDISSITPIKADILALLFIRDLANRKINQDFLWASKI
jgi:hypothetical protein